MPIPVTIPRLGWNMEEGTFVEWIKENGATIRPGDVVFRLEGEKATEEIESLDAGVLHIPETGPRPGDRLPVGAVIGYLLQTGESPPEVSPVAAVTISKTEVVTITETSTPLQQVKAMAAAPISPRARRVAIQRGLDWSQVRGTGRGGRIRERDIPSPSAGVTIPVSGVRRAIATRMMESRQTTAPVTLMSIVDATNLVALRNRLKQATRAGPVPSFTDLLVKLVATALQNHPILASRWTDSGIIAPTHINIGIAVDTEAGLLVPVLRGVTGLTIRDLSVRSRELIERARKGILAASEMQGGCFTVTNLGSFGIDAFTPIINPPECAVLGVGRIVRQPVMDGDRVVGRERVTLCLTFDHRIVDGGPAARFLQSLAKAIEEPVELLGLPDGVLS
jgi:pyruvate dehydrogenase E2 component (dihydrolipoamide acetyltransferase)